MSHCALSPCHRLKSQLIYGYYCESRSTPFSSDSGRANTWSISNLLSGHAWMWELDYKGSWELKNWCFWTVVLEKTLESPLDCKEIQPVNLKGNQSWISIGGTDAEAESPILWPPDVKNWLIWKDPDAGEDWRREEKGMTGWVGWMASVTQWTWVRVDSGSWWWTGRPGVLQCMGSKRVGHNWAAELNWTCLNFSNDSSMLTNIFF